MLETQHHGPIYVSGFVFRRSPGKAIMLECRIEHVLAMARRFHPCVEDGLGITLSRGHVFGGWSADTRLAQSRDEAIAPTDAVTDLSVTRHTPCLIKRGLLELGIGRHQRQAICLANSVENRVWPHCLPAGQWSWQSRADDVLLAGTEACSSIEIRRQPAPAFASEPANKDIITLNGVQHIRVCCGYTNVGFQTKEHDRLL